MLPVAVLCLAELVNVLGVTVAVPALPAIERDLDTSGALVVTGYAAAGLAPSAEALVVARCVQGAAAAAMIPNALSLLVAHAGERHGRAVAL